MLSSLISTMLGGNAEIQVPPLCVFIKPPDIQSVMIIDQLIGFIFHGERL